MGNKINIAELLKDCPKGMELDCPMYNKVTLHSVDNNKNIIFPIRILREDGNSITLTKYGQITDADFAKCVIFPKGKTTWKGFVPPIEFKDGDVVSTDSGSWIGITTGGKPENFIPTYCVIKSYGEFEAYLEKERRWSFSRLATEEEKQKLFDAIKANGYHWNSETKTLEKFLRFKIGDKIKKKGLNTTKYLEITDITPNIYIFRDGSFQYIKIIDKDYELIPNKFDITTLVPFESRVLVRSIDEGLWKPAIYGFSHQNGYYVVGGACWKQCIPYKGNEYLCGTTNACNTFYKTWEE